MSLTLFALVGPSVAQARTLVRVESDVADDLNFVRSKREHEQGAFLDTHEGLTSSGRDGDVRPGLAERWDISDDGLTAVFYLRDNAFWSDGTPIVARDFVHALEQRLMYNREGGIEAAKLIRNIVGVPAYLDGETDAFDGLGLIARDQHTLEMKLLNRDFYLLENLQDPIILPAHPDWSVQSDNGHTALIHSSGAYRPVAFEPNTHLKLVKNEYYYGAADVSVEEVEFYSYKTYPGEIYVDFLSGKLHYMRRPPFDMLQWFEENHPEYIVSASPQSFTYLDLNFRNPALAEREIRRALAMTIDRDAFPSILDARQYTVINRWFVEVLGGLPPTDFKFDDRPYAERVDEARKIIAAHGYGPGHPLGLVLRSGGSGGALKISDALVGMWRQIGIEVDHRHHENSREFYLEYMVKGNFDIGVAAWAGMTPDLGYFINFVHSDPEISGVYNFGVYANADVDRELDAARVATSLEERNRHLGLAETYLLEDYGKIPLYNNRSGFLAYPGVRGFGAGRYGVFPSKFLRFE